MINPTSFRFFRVLLKVANVSRKARLLELYGKLLEFRNQISHANYQNSFEYTYKSTAMHFATISWASSNRDIFTKELKKVINECPM